MRVMLLIAAVLLSPAACCAREATPTASRPEYASVLIKDVPHVQQRPDFCGEACAEMFLRKLGKPLDQDFVFDQSGLDPIHGRGCYSRELAAALQRVGFRTGSGWYGVSPGDSGGQLEAQFRALHADLESGVPSIICMHYDDQPRTTEHFRLMLGYDAQSDDVIYHEPAARNGAYRRMKREMLLKLWPLKYEERLWTIVRFRLEPGALTEGRAATSYTDADYAQHVMALKKRLSRLRNSQIELKQQREAAIERQLKLHRTRKAELETRLARQKERTTEARRRLEKAKKEQVEEKQLLALTTKLKSETKKQQTIAAEVNAEQRNYRRDKLPPRIVSDFHLVLQKPFVVVGDESPELVEQHAQGTIRWAVDRLKSDYFPKDPDHILDVWLFRDKQSYLQNTRDVFRSRPHTPFGYYSPSERALVMNIDTGTGTLVHEIVHPFMASNFPACPSWLNEGMGSLYEQCRDKDGHIWGLTNWRLRGLHELLKDEEYDMPTFEKLCGTTNREFYAEDPGSNYAQARYLCYYLQEKGLLVKFYREFHRSAKDDPTGYKTLQLVLDEEDMEEFQKKWAEFVLELRF